MKIFLIYKLVIYFFLIGFLNVLILPAQGYHQVLSCPSIEDVRVLRDIWPYGAWMPLYISNEELASEEDIERFHQSAQRFKRAEWNEDYLEAGHCFYEGVDDVVLARDMLAPDSAQYPNWIYLNHKIAWCETDDPRLCVYGVYIPENVVA